MSRAENKIAMANNNSNGDVIQVTAEGAAKETEGGVTTERQ